MSDYTTLVMWSGGLDSTYMLYKLAIEKKPFIVHHISFRNQLKRWIPEDKAVLALKQMFRNNRIIFDYSESIIDFSCFQVTGRDRDTILLAAQKTAFEHLNLKLRVAVAWNDTDMANASIVEQYEAGYVFKSWDALHSSMHVHNKLVSKELYMPLMGMTRKDIWEALPRRYRDLTWSCRRPVFKNETPYPCGICNTCQSQAVII